MRRVALALTAILLFAGCQQREGDAIVLSKEYIAAATSPVPNETVPAADATPADEALREMRDDEVAVDGYVMKAGDRGSSRDPRALKDEQWRVTVRTLADGRTLVVQAQQRQYDQLKEGDHVRVRYRSGKYTGTAWSAEIVP